MDNIYQKLIKAIRDKAFETGYYQAALEKCELSEKEREEYTELNRLAIVERNRLHGDLIHHIETNFFVCRGCQP